MSDVVGRLAKRPYQDGDPMPAVGSKCLVSGANCDVESDQHRAYGWRKVIGYSEDRKFVCMQTQGCWPTVERLSNCWFAEIPTPRQPETPAVDPSLPRGFIWVAQCAGCGVTDNPQARHFSECPAYPSEPVRPVKTSGGTP